ncbi:mannosyltransferase [Polyrhizophydium stewartii]|uniref:Chitobiosyldiphosphodolichol beta-mannosyltransferase n=1 Tax=Polyrhizophydium stewartii TaxID=2732419 RepID=A0ABR4N0H7_9FUNG
MHLVVAVLDVAFAAWAVVLVAVLAAAAGAAAVLRSTPARRKHVVVLVLGDIGHSPRMQNHALSLARNGFTVDLVGFGESAPRRELAESGAVRLVHLPAPSRIRSRSRIAYALLGLVRAASQSARLLWLLLRVLPKPEFVVVQNPPAIPTLAIAQLVSAALGARLVIDWHNFGFSLMPPRLTRNALLRGILAGYERLAGRSAFLHLCVTEAMAHELRSRWRVRGQVVVLYDKPTPNFAPLSPAAIHELLERIDFDAHDLSYRPEPCLPLQQTLLTRRAGNSRIELRPDRPAIVISSTSWTPDEDFDLLLDALLMYDAKASASDLSQLVIIITGKGPLKDAFMARLAKHRLTHVSIKFGWLLPVDYPRMVAAANLGVSLHTSSSGLDLPMKIIDMFGCGVPACSFRYPAISELVQDGVNGALFSDASELCERLVTLLGAFPSSADKLAALARGAERFRRTSWDAHWDASVLPHLSGQ